MWIQRTVSEADRSPPCIDEVLNEWRCTFIPPIHDDIKSGSSAANVVSQPDCVFMEVCCVAFHITGLCTTLLCS